MAFNSAGYWSCFVGVEDNNGKTSGISFYLDGALTLAQAETSVNAVATALANVTDGKVHSYSLMRVYRNDSTVAAAVTSNVADKLSLSFEDLSGDAKVTMKVPSPKAGIEQFGTDAIDPAQADVAALLTALIGNGDGTGNTIIHILGTKMRRLASGPKLITVSLEPNA